MASKVYSLNVVPGIQKDGTEFSSRRWGDGQWVRFYRGLPKKMAGYEQITTTDEIVNATLVINNGSNFSVYFATQTKIQFFQMNPQGMRIGNLIDITPLGSPIDGLPHIVQFGVMYSSVSNAAVLLAYASHDVINISSAETPIYYTDLNSANRLVNTNINVSGGFATLYPFLFAFGNDGLIEWTEANDPITTVNESRITSSKIVAGAQTRGGNSSPAGLFWSLDSLIRATFTGPTAADFTFDTISSDSSILSASSIVEYDGLFYWVGLDRFLFYNGVIQELPNDTNLTYFFNDLNYNYVRKIWGTKITKYGEIWWHYPSGNNTECDSAIIYNVREKCWYNTLSSRSSGSFNQDYGLPVWTSSDAINAAYPIWTHEFGTDQSTPDGDTAIESYIESGNIAWCAAGPDANFNGIDRWVLMTRFEPDLIQSGEMTLTVRGRAYARSPVIDSAPYTFMPNTTKLDFKEQSRIMTLKFESHVVGGDYEFGQMLMTCTIGDGRQNNAVT
jgi:hypothetical protein